MRACGRIAHGAAVFLVLSGAAAACPTAEEIDGNGVYFIHSDGLRELHFVLDGSEALVEGGLIAKTVWDDQGMPTGETSLALYGLYPTSSVVGEHVNSMFYDDEVARPVPQRGMTVEVAVDIKQRRIETSGVMTLTVDDTPAGVKFGDCTLEVWAAAYRVDLGDEKSFGARVHWFPTLGTGFEVQSTLNGELGAARTVVGLDW